MSTVWFLWKVDMRPSFLDSDACRLSSCPLSISCFCLVRNCSYRWTQRKTEKLSEAQPQLLHPQAHYWIWWVWDNRKTKGKPCREWTGTFKCVLIFSPRGMKAKSIKKKTKNKKLSLCVHLSAKEKTPPSQPNALCSSTGNGKRVLCKIKEHVLTHLADPWASNLMEGMG